MTKYRNHRDLTVPLPQSWIGLFGALMSPRHPDMRADIWYQESVDSGYGHQPAWGEVLQALTIVEPYISFDTQQLCFKPRLLHLPTEIQVHFLKFLCRHSHRIPDREINTFVHTIGPHLQEGESLAAELKLLQCCSKNEIWEDNIFKMVEDTSEKLKGVGQIKIPLLKEKSETGAEESKHTSDDVVIILDEDDDYDEEPKSKRRKIEHSQDIDISIENKVDETGVSDRDKDKTASVGNDTELNVLNSLENKPDLSDSTGKEPSEEFSSCELELKLSQAKKQGIEKLKEIWHNAVEECPSEDLQLFVSLTSDEMRVAMEILELSEICETAVVVACGHIVGMSDLISYSNCVSFLNSALCDKVMTLTQNASRGLSSAVTMVTDKYPKQTIDGVLVPCFSGNFGAPQMDLISYLVKECLSVGNQFYFLTKLNSCDGELNDSKISLIQNLIETVNIDNDAINSLLSRFETQAPNLVKNLKFSKLLLALVNKHGKVMMKDSLLRFASIVDKNKTFLKKSIENVVKKLKS